MAPSRKKGGVNKGKAKGQLKFGDLVLAKVKGFPAWPAKISMPLNWDRSPDPRKHFVEFFGTAEIAFVAPADIQVFTEESRSKLSARCQGKTVKHFADAVKEICEVFDEMQQKKSAGPSEDDKSALGLVPSAADVIEDSVHQIYQETTHMKNVEKKLEEHNTNKSECSADEPHGSKSERQEEIVSFMQARCSVRTDSPDLSLGKRKKVENKEGKSFVAKSDSGTHLVEADRSTAPHSDHNGRNALDKFSKSELKKAQLGNIVDLQKRTCTGNSTDLIVKEPNVKDDNASKVRKNHIHKKSWNSSVLEEELSWDGENAFSRNDGISELGKNSSRLDNETNLAKKSKKDANGKHPLHGVKKSTKSDTLKEHVAEDSSSSYTRGKTSLLGNKKQKSTHVDNSQSTKRSKHAGEGVENCTRNTDSSHSAGKVEGGKVARANEFAASLQYELHMTSESETQHDRKHTVTKDATDNQSREYSRISESASISALKNITHATGKSSIFANSGVAISSNKKSPATHVRSRRRSFRIDDDDDEFHRTPVHRESVSSLISAHSNDHVTEICNNSLAISRNAPTENLHSKRQKISSTDKASDAITHGSASPNSAKRKEIKFETSLTEIVLFKEEKTSCIYQASPLSIGHGPLSPNLPERKEMKLEVELKLKASHSPLRPEYQKSSSRENIPLPFSPKIKMPEHKQIKSEAKSSSSAPTNNVQCNTLKPSIHASADIFHARAHKDTPKDKSSSISLQFNVETESNERISTVTENRSNINFSAELNIERDPSMLQERLGAGKRDKAGGLSVGSKLVDSDKSLKNLIEAAQAKRKEHFQKNPLGNATPAVSSPPRTYGYSPNPIYAVNPILSESYHKKDAQESYLCKSFDSPSVLAPKLLSSQIHHTEYDHKISPPAYRQHGSSLSCGTEAAVARDALEGMLETLSRTKESIGRATRLAINCAKYGIASEIVELLIRKLEGEPDLQRRIDLFFLVDSITQISHGQKGIAGASYIPTVQASLPRLLGAAAPPGTGAHENRRQCLKVLKLWLERNILPEQLLRRYMDGIVVPNDDVNGGFLLRRPSRAERSVDDPIREMEGMLVDEYGSNANFRFPGFFPADTFEDDDDLSSDPCKDNGIKTHVEADSAPEEPDKCALTPSDKSPCILKDVDGELEMEDVSASLGDDNVSLVLNSQHQEPCGYLELQSKNFTDFPPSLLDSPPLPLDSPPPPPPFPSSPPPPLPPSSPPSPPRQPLPALPFSHPPALPPLPCYPNPTLPPSSPAPPLHLPPPDDCCMTINDNQPGQTSGNTAFQAHGNTSVKSDITLQQHTNFVGSGNCNTQSMPGFTAKRPFEYGANDRHSIQASDLNHQIQQGSRSFHQRPYEPIPPVQTPPRHPIGNAHIPGDHYTYREPMGQRNQQQSYNRYSFSSVSNGQRQYLSNERKRIHSYEIREDNQHSTWLARGRGQSSSGSPFVQDGFPRSIMERSSSLAMNFHPPMHSPMPSRNLYHGRGYPRRFPFRPDGYGHRWRPS